MLTILAHAFLTITTADQRDQHSDDDGQPPLTVNKTRRPFLTILTLPAPALDHVLPWPTWRRRHHANANANHYRRRNHQPN